MFSCVYVHTRIYMNFESHECKIGGWLGILGSSVRGFKFKNPGH